MADSQIVVALGKEKITLTYVPGMTFGDLRRQVAKNVGEDAATFRFLYKGRSVKDDEPMCKGDAPAVIKVMTLRTKAYHDSQGGASSKRTSGSSGYHDALDEARAKERERKVSIETSRPTEPKGDAIEEGEDYVVVRVFRERYHVRTNATMTIGQLKERLADMEGVDVRNEDMNLIYSGRKVQNADKLAEVGVRRGSMFLLIRAAAHHDAQDARAELGRMRIALSRLEGQAGKLQRERTRRLIDDEGFRARLGELEREADILRDQLRNNKCDEDAQKDVKAALTRAEEVLEKLRETVV